MFESLKNAQTLGAVLEATVYGFFCIVILESELELEERASGEGSLDVGRSAMK